MEKKNALIKRIFDLISKRLFVFRFEVFEFIGKEGN